MEEDLTKEKQELRSSSRDSEVGELDGNKGSSRLKQKGEVEEGRIVKILKLTLERKPDVGESGRTLKKRKRDGCKG